MRSRQVVGCGWRGAARRTGCTRGFAPPAGAVAAGAGVAAAGAGVGSDSVAVTAGLAAACLVGSTVWAEACAVTAAMTKKARKTCNFIEIPLDAPADEGRTLPASPGRT
jgi:hypothetical protein